MAIDVPEVFTDAPMFDMGAWLAERRAMLDGGEASWLAVLVDFDLAEGWAADGQLSAVYWLQWRLKMGRSTAFDKVRVAHALRRRPKLMAALAAGEVSYCAVRAITRIDYPSTEVEDALIALARDGTIADVERAVRYHLMLADQERDPSDDAGLHERRSVQVSRGFRDAMGKLDIRLTNLELEEFAAVLDAFTNAEAGDGSSGGDRLEDPPNPWWAKRADAFMEMVRVAMTNLNGGRAVGADRYLVHLVARIDELTAGGNGEHLDGRPLDAAALAQVACDCSTVAHLLGGDGQPLALGRKQHEWNTAQRRAITVRDGGRCRFPGCGRRRNDIHHVIPWAPGGLTDIENGCCQCPRHHSLVHSGWRVEGDANHELLFYRPDGSYLGSTFPLNRTPSLLREAA